MKKLLFFILLPLFISCSKPTKKEAFSVGIIADCQYCECDVKWNRYYKKAPQRLKEAVNELNQHDLAYTVHLGDFIDQYFESFDSIVPTWKQLNSDAYHVLGNHDFDVADSLKPLVFEKLNLKKRYYSIEKENWKFLMIDGTDLSFYGTFSADKKEETKQLFSKIKNDSLPYAKPYNGGLGKEQFHWIENELKEATKNGKNVGLYCHFPLTPIQNDNLWNTIELQELFKKYDCVKVFMNGHNHEGAYEYKDNIHYLTFKGMVNTADSTSYAIARFHPKKIEIKGYGREPNRILTLSN